MLIRFLQRYSTEILPQNDPIVEERLYETLLNQIGPPKISIRNL